MSNNVEKQLFQVQNIIETLQEATVHFANLVKGKELNQSIFIFSSIVEGCNAIIQILSEIEGDYFKTHLQSIERHLLLIAKQLEQGNFIKIAEIIQFSFAPELKKLQNTFIDTQGNQKKEKTISIGFFHSWANPKDFYPPERLKSTIYEGEKQNTNLYFFTSDDVNFEEEQIDALIFQNNSWHRSKVAFPDVIHNIGVGKQSRVERKLRRLIPFTSFHVGNKFSLPLRMLENRDYTELLVPFRLCVSKKGVYSFLEQNNRVVFKALKSNRGENIYFLTKKGNRYILLDQKKESILSQDALTHFIEKIILAEKGSYIIQRYIHTRTKDDEPYHFRAHVQKNGEGKWQLTHIYPRLGSKKSNLSNISTEGRVENFHDFLINEFGEKAGSKYEEEILDLSIKVAAHLDKLYGLVLDELGLDFAIDDQGKVWMHEANNGPQTAYHEEKRAVNTIAYAKYIAENGIVNNKTVYIGLPKDQFRAKTSKLPIMKSKEQVMIALLVENIKNENLIKCIAEIAKSRHMEFYYCTSKDIDFDEMFIRGNYYENGEWNKRIYEFPDVIINFIKSKDSTSHQIMYEELEHIPFTNRSFEHMNNRSEILNILAKKDCSINYEKVNRLRDVFRSLEEYGKVLLKREDILSKQVYSIVDKGKRYQVNHQNKIKYYNELQLRKLLQDLIDERNYIVQKDSRGKIFNEQLFEIDIHLMKNEENEWSIVSENANIQATLNENETQVYTEPLSNFIRENYSKESIEVISNLLTKFSLDKAALLERESTINLSELVLTLTLNNENEVNIVEINPNGPSTITDERAYANAIITYAKYLNDVSEKNE